jgi:AcrR family transcriptional regulator
MRDRILDVATELFLAHGYGATSVEAVAKRTRISKRTFYHRFRDKADLFGAVVRRLIERWRPPIDAHLVDGGPLDEVLGRLALEMLSVALSPQALALHRVVLAEAKRFPELARIVYEHGSAQGILRIGELLQRESAAGRLRLREPAVAAEQFIQMVVAVPQRRALGLGTPMDQGEVELWARRAVDLFLHGCASEAAGA